MHKVLVFLGILDDTDIDWIIRNGTRRTLAEGDVIIEEGKPAEQLYFVLDGELGVTSKDAPGVELSRMKAGEIVGEISFVDSRPPSATVTARMESVVGSVLRSTMAEKLEEDLSFAARFYKSVAVLLSDRLRTKDSQARSEGSPNFEVDEDFDEMPEHLADLLYLAGMRFADMQRRSWGA